jgi:hypothetical protein
VNRRLTNVLLVMAVALIYVALGAYSGRTSVNGGLGTEGPIYAAMITAHDVQGGTVGNRVWPAFPLAAALAYAVTGSVETSFVIVGFVAVLVLAYAACRILDAAGAPPAIKVCAVLTLGVLGLPTAITAFAPAQPYLLGVAMTTLAVAAIESPSTRVAGSGQAGRWLSMAATQVGATLASPVGIMAPLYGLARNWQAKERRGVLVAAMLPGLLIWLLVQVWARGGPAGFLDLLRFSRVRSDAVLWTEFAFILFGAYFLLTTLGGLTVLLWSRPRWIQDTLRDRPALWALLVPPLVFIGTAGLEVPPMTAFLIPFWLIVIAGWARLQTAPLLVPSLLAGVMTILTQHPWRKVTDASYFADWFPYSIHAARVSAVTMSDAMLIDIWRVRIFIAAAGLVASVAWWRRNIRQP